MKLLVFGKTGQVATALQALAGPDLQVDALGRDAADLSDPEACAALVSQTSADAIINAAAYTAVDRAEEEEALATKINGAAPTAMAQAAAARGLPFLHISTDYVFDGTGTTARTPEDVTAPCNAYGRSKLAGELGVSAANGPHVILRTSWVFSASGANFVKTMLRLGNTRDALSVVDDQVGGPTAAEDIAQTLVTMARAMHQGQTGGIYHYAGATETNWAAFAREIFSRAGLSVAVTGIPTSAYPTPASRPLNSRLNCDTLLADFGVTQPSWSEALDKVLAQLATNKEAGSV